MIPRTEPKIEAKGAVVENDARHRASIARVMVSKTQRFIEIL